jgi:lipopolysaccharide transport protein LptA
MEFIRRSFWFLTACAALILPASAATILPVSQDPIALDAESSEYDRNRNQLLFRRVHITQGDLSIAADQAVANDLDFAASTWEFTGDVQVDGQGARIRANSATIRFADHRLVRATASGAPATFERDASEELRALSGDADVIDYDAVELRLELRGGAHLMDGPNRFNGHKLVYLVDEDRLVASSNEDGEQQISVIITPSTIENRNGGDDAQETEADPDKPSAPPTSPPTNPAPRDGEPPQ